MTTETDRELLKMAAKAVGHSLSDEWDSAAHGILIGTGKGDLEVWNPIDDDGDALRLAVKLQMTICIEQVESGVVYCTQPIGASTIAYPEVRSGNSEPEVIKEDYAAVRLAIVLAAAEIGRSAS